MVSILIPVFGESIDAQLASLAAEAKGLDYPVEIIVCDDASPSPKEPHFSDYKGVDFKFLQLDENMGRARIRNYLAEQASFNILIFIDADCQPILGNFISNYVSQSNDSNVLVGGQLFAAEKPSSQKVQLRWLYGTKVEARALKERKKFPYTSFMANNFCISKSLLNQYPFDSKHTGYGHEDTLFGMQLRNFDVEVVHIENPIRHLGAETNEQFLDKTEEGVRNLATLYLQGKLDSHVRLIKTYEQLLYTGFVGLTRNIMAKRQNGYRKNLVGPSPNLRKFSLFKLGAFMIELEKLRKEAKMLKSKPTV